MELTPLRYVLAIADARHMTRAAERLGVAQPTLSSALSKLEAELGAPLFHRTGRGVEPTEAGLVFLEEAERAVRAADAGREAVRRVVGLDEGRLRIGGGATAVAHLLPPVISRFRSEHPGIRFSVREAGSSDIARSIAAGELDLGVVTLPIRVPGGDDLLTVAKSEDELLLVVPPGHPLAGERSFRWAQLAGEPLVVFEAGSAVRRAIDEAAERAGATLTVVMELRSIDAITRMVESGVGPGFVSRFALPAGAPGLACADEPLRRTLGVVRRSDRIPSPAAQRFEELLLDHLASASERTTQA
jgi:DNA-binding transcriptional LysR family regulator